MTIAPCHDCGSETLSAEPGVPTEYYVVHPAVWAGAGMEPSGGCLCVGCLEARLGRQLHRGDFAAEVINDLAVSNTDHAWSWRSDRLRDRLAAPPPSEVQAPC